VQNRSGELLILNAVNGSVQAVHTNQVFWCEHQQKYDVNIALEATGQGERTGSATFDGCFATGKTTTSIPVTQSAAVGINVDRLFIWPTQHGLRAVPTR
jgi:hypothetical protein